MRVWPYTSTLLYHLLEQGQTIVVGQKRHVTREPPQHVRAALSAGEKRHLPDHRAHRQQSPIVPRRGSRRGQRAADDDA